MPAPSALPQLGDTVFLTDAGIETTLIFDDGLDLPEFAAFVLLADDAGRAALRRYFLRHASIARDAGAGFVLEAPTWRANPDWAGVLGYSLDELDRANRSAIDLMTEVRDGLGPSSAPVVVSGCVGPRSDGYRPDRLMTPEGAESYHARQVDTFAHTAADLVTAVTMTHSAEAIGIARAAAARAVPAVISFTVETDGTLPSGESLGDAVRAVDDATDGYPAYFMLNCAHPTHFVDTLRSGGEWTARIRGLRANASTLSHAELDEAEELDTGDPQDLGAWYAALRAEFPALTVLGGCCGTDHRHIEAITATCVTAHATARGSR
jgi:S-methylmethionine-dependent homocysteine/selenocysteine methylase